MNRTILKIGDTIDSIQRSWPGKPATWETACDMIVHELAFSAGHNIGNMGPATIENHYDAGQWDILARGALANITWHDEVSGRGFGGTDVSALLARKQADYGPRNILRFEVDGLAVRLWDKVARYNNLVEKGQRPENESLVDTQMDIVGYTVIAIMLELDWFNLPLQTELEVA